VGGADLSKLMSSRGRSAGGVQWNFNASARRKDTHHLLILSEDDLEVVSLLKKNALKEKVSTSPNGGARSLLCEKPTEEKRGK